MLPRGRGPAGQSEDDRRELGIVSPELTRRMKKIRGIFFPIFNWGQAGVVLILTTVLGLVSIYSDPLLALYIGIGAYVGIVIRTILLGLAPDEIEVHENEVGPITIMLNSGRLIEQIGDRVWAGSRYKSWLWKSDWISISEDEPGKFRLKARRRDLKIVLAKLRQQGLR